MAVPLSPAPSFPLVLNEPGQRAVYVYSPNQSVQHLANPATLPGAPLLADFVLDLSAVW